MVSRFLTCITWRRNKLKCETRGWSETRIYLSKASLSNDGGKFEIIDCQGLALKVVERCDGK